MRKRYQLGCAIIFMGLLFNCSDQKPEEKETSKMDAPKKDRNMFGLYIPRGLTKTSENLTPGYVMFRPANSASIYLVGREGKVVHEWKSNYGIGSFYLNDDGSISVLAIDPDFPVFAGGGEAGRLQKLTWDSKIVWDFEYANEQHHAHHDIAVMPNGNFLAIAWEAKTAEEVLKAGRKPDMIPKAGLWPSTIVEVEPNGKTGGNIIWEWHIWDHLIQDSDPRKR